MFVGILEILEGDKKGRNGVVQSTAKRRPPPLPLNNLENTRKSVKPPPLPSRNSVSIAEGRVGYYFILHIFKVHSNFCNFDHIMCQELLINSY